MILDGKLVANNIKQQLKEEINQSDNRAPHLVIFTAGDDPASKVYVRNKIKAAKEVGIEVDHIIITEADGGESALIHHIRRANEESNIDGIMVQLPLPENYNERLIIDTINPDKDVDGLTTFNIGLLRSGQRCIKPCTAQGIIDLLDYYNVDIDGKHVTIVGRSNIVGKPVADLLLNRGATITQCHSHTHNLFNHTLDSDIVISAIGKPKFITDDMIHCGAIVIDVGINRDDEGKLCGDVDFDNVQIFASAITPVPGGVGPMTVVELMKNTVECWRKNT